MTCPRCKSDAIRIEQAPDSFARRVFCPACQFTEWLKYFNKKKTNLFNNKKCMNKDYKEIVSENSDKFNDEQRLLDFIENYANEERGIKDLEDYIAEQADELVPVYNWDIVKEWQKNRDCQEMTIEVCGEYNAKDGIYKMMASDLGYWHEQQLREDYEKLLELLELSDEEEAPALDVPAILEK